MGAATDGDGPNLVLIVLAMLAFAATIIYLVMQL